MRMTMENLLKRAKARVDELPQDQMEFDDKIKKMMTVSFSQEEIQEGKWFKNQNLGLNIEFH